MQVELSCFQIKKEELSKIVEIYPSGKSYCLALGDDCFCELSPSGKTLYLYSKNCHGEDICINTFRVNKTIFGLKEE